MKLNIDILIGSGGHRRILDNGNLVISPVSRDDEGVYTCTASNIYGQDESQGRLIVLHGPRLIEALQPQITMPVQHNLNLKCQADTEEFLDIAYLWLHNGMLIRDNDIMNNPRLVRYCDFCSFYNIILSSFLFFLAR